jgi:hypothetical protein
MDNSLEQKWVLSIFTGAISIFLPPGRYYEKIISVIKTGRFKGAEPQLSRNRRYRHAGSQAGIQLFQER